MQVNLKAETYILSVFRSTIHFSRGVLFSSHLQALYELNIPCMKIELGPILNCSKT